MLFVCLGLLELLVAVVLGQFAWSLPTPVEVEESVGRVEKVSRRAGEQVHRLGEQVRQVRARRPQMEQLARQLEIQMRLASQTVRSQQINYTTVGAVRDSLGDVADGLDSFSAMLDPQGLGQIGAGLKATADYLDERIAPAAERAADHLEQSTAALKADADRLKELLEKAPLDLKAASLVVESLTRFEEGLEGMSRVTKAESFDTMREGLKGLEEALDTSAGQVEKFSDYTIPQMKLEGLKLKVEQKDFWPEGKTIAEGMRKGAKGAAAAGKEMDAIGKELPRLRTSVEETRKVVSATRASLAMALKQQDKLEAVLKSIPGHTSRLAEELPQLGKDLAKILRDTSRLKEVAQLLRQAQKGVDTASARWPDLRKNLGKTADLLRNTQKQLSAALDNREQYESALKQTVDLTDTFAMLLPLMTEQLGDELERQEQSLAELGGSIDQLSEALPAAGQTASRLVQTTRLLLALVGVIVMLHGAYMVAQGRRRGS
jgi:hypothetical protein